MSKAHIVQKPEVRSAEVRNLFELLLYGTFELLNLTEVKE